MVSRWQRCSSQQQPLKRPSASSFSYLTPWGFLSSCLLPSLVLWDIPHLIIHLLLNESKCPFLTLATKALNFYREMSMKSVWEGRTRLLSRLRRTRLPAVLWVREVREGSREQMRLEMGPEDTQALTQKGSPLRYFTLLIPMGRHMTLEFGQGGTTLCRTHTPPSNVLFCERLQVN